MISHEHKFIFIHIPKCAGTSIEMAFGHSADGIREPDHRSIRMLENPLPIASLVSVRDNWFHLALRVKHSLKVHRNPNNKRQVSSTQYAEYFKFAVVRNPWARAHSWYKACMRDAAYRIRLGLPENVTFREFLYSQAGRGGLRPQTSWIKDFRGHIPLDYIARFETLDQDLQHVYSRLKINRITLPHERKGSGEDYRISYDDDLVRLISEIYLEEIEFFGYSFQLTVPP